MTSADGEIIQTYPQTEQPDLRLLVSAAQFFSDSEEQLYSTHYISRAQGVQCGVENDAV